MSESYRAYIDESGDQGFNFEEDGSGSSRWLLLSAVVVRSKDEQRIDEEFQRLRKLLRKAPSFDIHFKKLRHDQRVALLRAVGQLPIRSIVVAFNKQLMDPSKWEGMRSKMYRFASEILTERISWMCRDDKAQEGDGYCELIFSEQSSMAYDEMRKHLRSLKTKRTNARLGIAWNTIDPDRLHAIPHQELNGLALADLVASSLYWAIRPDRYGELEPRYYQLIKETLYRRKARVSPYGLKFFPDSLAEQQKRYPHLTVLEG